VNVGNGPANGQITGYSTPNASAYTYEDRRNPNFSQGFTNATYESGGTQADQERREKSKATGQGGILSNEVIADARSFKPDAGLYALDGRSGAYDEELSRYRGLGNMSGARSAPQMDPGYQNQARAWQNIAASEYFDAATGRKPSVAQAQMMRGLGQSQSANTAMAASMGGGGVNRAAGLRAAMRANNQQAGDVTSQAGIAAMQERERAREGLMQSGTSMRGQDIGFAQGNAQLQAGQNALNDQREMGYERLGAGLQEQQFRAQQEYAKQLQQSELEQRKLNQRTEEYNSSAGGVGAIGQLVGGIASVFSDENAKKDIRKMGEESEDWSKSLSARMDSFYGNRDEERKHRMRALDEEQAELDAKKKGGGGLFGGLSDKRQKSGESKLRDFSRKIEPFEYRYKDEPSSAPKRPGIMAQDAEKSALGEEIVADTPAGKVMKMPETLGVSLASISLLRKEVDELKAKLKAKDSKAKSKGKKKRKDDDEDED
jgi:hypothetical protein